MKNMKERITDLEKRVHDVEWSYRDVSDTVGTCDGRQERIMSNQELISDKLKKVIEHTREYDNRDVELIKSLKNRITDLEKKMSSMKKWSLW